MTDLVDPDEIEGIIGFPRHGRLHLAIHDTGGGEVYVMHSQACVDSGIDLRDCEFSLALDDGVARGFPGDRAVIAQVCYDGRLGWAPWGVLDQWRLP